MKTLVEFKDGRSEVYENAGPNIYDGMLSLVGPDCERTGRKPIDPYYFCQRHADVVAKVVLESREGR